MQASLNLLSMSKKCFSFHHRIIWSCYVDDRISTCLKENVKKVYCNECLLNANQLTPMISLKPKHILTL